MGKGKRDLKCSFGKWQWKCTHCGQFSATNVRSLSRKNKGITMAEFIYKPGHIFTVLLHSEKSGAVNR